MPESVATSLHASVAHSRPALSDAQRGLLYGVISVLCFGCTPVGTRAAVMGGINPFFVGAGRAFGAALLAAPSLFLTRQPWPNRAQLWRLGPVIVGLAFGFPLLTAWALQYVPAAHAATIFGLLPLATAVAACARGGERPARPFWLASGAGSLLVVGFAWHEGAGHLHPADLALLAAVVLTAIGYAEGAALSRSMGGWQVISWTLALASPGTGAVTAITLVARRGAVWHALTSGAVSPGAWLGMGYVTLFSQWLGFFVWYRALALGGVARISQLQLLMPFVTLLISAALLGEPLRASSLLTALAVCVTVVVGQRFAPRRSVVNDRAGAS